MEPVGCQRLAECRLQNCSVPCTDPWARSLFDRWVRGTGEREIFHGKAD